MVFRWNWKTLSSVRKTSSKPYSAQSLEKVFFFIFCTSLSSGTIFGNFCTYPDENKYFATVVRCAVFPVSWATICESFEDDESGLLRANSQIFCLSESENISVVQIQPSVPVFLRFRAFSCFAEMFLGPYLISFVRCSDHELNHWSIIQEYLAASACFHEIVNKLYVFCFSAATHEKINVTCFEREVPCLYIVPISRTFVGSKIHNNPFCKSDIFFAHHYTLCNPVKRKKYHNKQTVEIGPVPETQFTSNELNWIELNWIEFIWTTWLQVNLQTQKSQQQEGPTRLDSLRVTPLWKPKVL